MDHTMRAVTMVTIVVEVVTMVSVLYILLMIVVGVIQSIWEVAIVWVQKVFVAEILPIVMEAVLMGYAQKTTIALRDNGVKAKDMVALMTVVVIPTIVLDLVKMANAHQNILAIANLVWEMVCWEIVAKVATTVLLHV